MSTRGGRLNDVGFTRAVVLSHLLHWTPDFLSPVAGSQPTPAWRALAVPEFEGEELPNLLGPVLSSDRCILDERGRRLPLEKARALPAPTE